MENFFFLKTRWQFLMNLNTPLSHDPAIMLLCVYPREFKTKIQKKLPHVYNNFIYNSPNWKKPNGYINRRMDKQIMAYSYNGALLDNKKRINH